VDAQCALDLFAATAALLFLIVHRYDVAVSWLQCAGEKLEEFDVVLSCAKAHHLPAALPTLKRLVGPNTLLVTIQVRACCQTRPCLSWNNP
jgi:hypothetical protein